jgi:endonuclease/exonuclease/phosphatase family metal-dependent hydrolase
VKIATWNVNHRASRKAIPDKIAPAIISIGADVLVFTEFVHCETKQDRKAFYDQLKNAGYNCQFISPTTPKENHILIASRIPIVQGDLQAPTTIQSAVPSNFLHVKCLDTNTEIIGIRVPDYSKTAHKKIAQEYWTWFSSFTQDIADRSIIMTGDFNIDPDMKKYKFRHHLTDLMDIGWKMASPKEGASYYANQNNAPHRLDHAFINDRFEIMDASYIQEVAGLWTCGENKYKEPDHAILLIEVA